MHAAFRSQLAHLRSGSSQEWKLDTTSFPVRLEDRSVTGTAGQDPSRQSDCRLPAVVAAQMFGIPLPIAKSAKRGRVSAIRGFDPSSDHSRIDPKIDTLAYTRRESDSEISCKSGQVWQLFGVPPLYMEVFGRRH